MARPYGLVAGLRPEIFDAIETPRISSADAGPASDGLPSYAKLEVLIAYLTAPTSLSYDTISDFLMTFRMYASSTDIWYLLASRILWAASVAARTGGESETGRDVGTRSFVLIRQWFRDYFIMDFAPDRALREDVAETLTILAGCTEFVLIDYFHRILCQLRGEWDAQVGRLWALPSNVAGDIDSAVPVGGEPIDPSDAALLCASRPGADLSGPAAPPAILTGQVPIDADIAVPSIQASPPRRKPRTKLSSLFRKHEADQAKPEAVLHEKVDLLAMQLINEYHLRERAQNLQMLPDSSVRAQRPPHRQQDRPQPAATQQSPYDACQSSSPLQQQQSPGPRQPLQQHPLQVQQVDTFDQPRLDDHSEPPGSPLPQDAQHAVPPPQRTLLVHTPPLSASCPPQQQPRTSACFEQRHRPHSSVVLRSHEAAYPAAEDQHMPRSFTLPESHDLRQAHEALGHLRLSQESVISTPRRLSGQSTENAMADQTRSGEPDDRFNTPTPSLFEDEVWATPGRPSSVFDEPDVPMPISPSFGACEEGEVSHQEDVADTTAQPVVASLEASLEASLDDLDDVRTQSDDEADGHLDTVDTAQLRATAEADGASDSNVTGKEGTDNADTDSLACGRRENPAEDEPQAHPMMVHEQSVDTLNLHDMVLANTSCDSEAELDLADQSVPIAENWGVVDYDQFDQVSYSGSSLSTLSTTTRSASSFHANGKASLFSGVSIDHRASTDHISLLSEIENSLLQPCAGYTSADAARLKAIPDYDLGGDALLATLQLLEGTISHSVLPLHPSQDTLHQPATIPRSDTIELYSQALDPSAGPEQASPSRGSPYYAAARQPAESLACEVSRLGIATNTGSFAPQPPKQFQGIVVDDSSSASHITKDSLGDLQPPPSWGAPTSSSDGLVSEQFDLPSPIPVLHIGLPSATHAPFILSFSARAAAEQLTYIESQVASQIDFFSLVRMEPTKPLARKVVSWLEVVMEEPPMQSTALVMARFDLVYRWVQSEVILCPSPALQAQAVSRFIHISFEALRLQNFATMVQVVLGLKSREVQSQLSREALGLVPAHDREVLERLETLASPTHNYAKLRMAHSRLSLAKGCVPFTPMFLSDIELTAQAASSNAEQEIHFGKYRVASQVVKSLRKYVRAAASYNIAPEPALLSKCLYLAAIPNLS